MRSVIVAAATVIVIAAGIMLFSVPSFAPISFDGSPNKAGGVFGPTVHNSGTVESCRPTADSRGWRCIPVDSHGNIDQLGGVIPAENPGLPSSGFFD
jgi:hypothetical protein